MPVHIDFLMICVGFRLSTSTGTDGPRLMPVQASWGRSGAGLGRLVQVPQETLYSIVLHKFFLENPMQMQERNGKTHIFLGAYWMVKISSINDELTFTFKHNK